MNVFDSSAVLALVFNEPGTELATRLMDADDALISSVNQAEVLGKLHDTGMPAEEAALLWRQLPLKVLPFTAEHAQLAGQLRPPSPAPWSCRWATAAAWRWPRPCPARKW